MYFNGYLRAAFGIGTSQSNIGVVGVETCGVGFSISRFCNFSICVGVNIVHGPRLGIDRANIHPSNSPKVGHFHSNQLEFPGKVLLPLPLIYTKIIIIFELIRFFYLYIPLLRLGCKCATEVSRIP